MFILIFSSLATLAIDMPLNQDQLKIFGGTVEVLMDKNREYSIDDLPLTNFTKPLKSCPNFGFYDGVVWLRFKVDSKEKRKILLELKNPNLDNVKVYRKTLNGFELIDQVGDDFSFSQRKIKHRFFQIEIEIPIEIILQVSNLGNKCFVPIDIVSEKAVLKRDYEHQFYWGLYFGLLLFIFSLTLVIYVMLRKKSTFYYLCYLIVTVVAQISNSGFGRQYFWKETTFFSNRSLPLTGVFSALFLVLFVRYFLKTKKYSPRLHKYYTFVIILLVSTGILAVLPSNQAYHWASIILNLLLVLASIPIFPIAYSAIKRGFKPAGFFFWSIGVLSLSVWIFVFHNFGWIPSNSLTASSLQIGTAGEFVLFTLAIIQQLKGMKEKASNTLIKINTMKDTESIELAQEIEIRVNEVVQNKLEIQEQNEKILSSLSYARSIQEIIIPKESEFIEGFIDGFVLTQAKDIVSGDFYWRADVDYGNKGNKDKLQLICVGDCTGHGVPGALISVLGLRILNSSLSDKGVYSASTTLDYLHHEFVKLFQSGEEDVHIRDGMDCAIGVFNLRKNILEFSAAKNSMFLVRNGEIVHYKGDKQEIGSSTIHKSFSQIEIQLIKGDRIYMYTDGYTDQFGGELHKKIKPAKLKQLILENHKKPMCEQKSIYYEYFNQWKGSLEQTDDMCLVGVEI